MKAHEKAEILVEALPYIRRWAGKTVVIKVGGEVLDAPAALDGFATDIALLRYVGMNPIVVHGGGDQISQMMRQLRKEPQFHDGQRVTDVETMDIVKMVILGKVNKSLVRAINSKGVQAVGISGEDGGLLRAEPLSERLGFVGKVTGVSRNVLDTLIDAEYIPVVAPTAAGPGGTFNINADIAASSIAVAMDAAKVVFMTNVKGLFSDVNDESTLISETQPAGLKRLLEDGSLSNGMIPKVSSASSAIEQGVPQAHIVDGRVPHVLLLEIFTDEGIGTMVVP